MPTHWAATLKMLSANGVSLANICIMHYNMVICHIFGHDIITVCRKLLRERERERFYILMVIFLILINVLISSIFSNLIIKITSSCRCPPVTTIWCFSWNTIWFPVSDLRWPYNTSHCSRTSTRWSTNTEVPSSIFPGFTLGTVNMRTGQPTID